MSTGNSDNNSSLPIKGLSLISSYSSPSTSPSPEPSPAKFFPGSPTHNMATQDSFDEQASDDVPHPPVIAIHDKPVSPVSGSPSERDKIENTVARDGLVTHEDIEDHCSSSQVDTECTSIPVTCPRSHTDTSIPVTSPRSHTDTSIPVTSPRSHTDTSIPVTSPRSHTDTSIPVTSPHSHTDTSIPVTSPHSHTDTSIPVTSPHSHTNTSIPVISPHSHTDTSIPVTCPHSHSDNSIPHTNPVPNAVISTDTPNSLIPIPQQTGSNVTSDEIDDTTQIIAPPSPISDHTLVQCHNAATTQSTTCGTSNLLTTESPSPSSNVLNGCGQEDDEGRGQEDDEERGSFDANLPSTATAEQSHVAMVTTRQEDTQECEEVLCPEQLTKTSMESKVEEMNLTKWVEPIPLGVEPELLGVGSEPDRTPCEGNDHLEHDRNRDISDVTKETKLSEVIDSGRGKHNNSEEVESEDGRGNEVATVDEPIETSEKRCDHDEVGVADVEVRTPGSPVESINTVADRGRGTDDVTGLHGDDSARALVSRNESQSKSEEEVQVPVESSSNMDIPASSSSHVDKGLTVTPVSMATVDEQSHNVDTPSSYDHTPSCDDVQSHSIATTDELLVKRDTSNSCHVVPRGIVNEEGVVSENMGVVSANVGVVDDSMEVDSTPSIDDGARGKIDCESVDGHLLEEITRQEVHVEEGSETSVVSQSVVESGTCTSDRIVTCKESTIGDDDSPEPAVDIATAGSDIVIEPVGQSDYKGYEDIPSLEDAQLVNVSEEFPVKSPVRESVAVVSTLPTSEFESHQIEMEDDEGMLEDTSATERTVEESEGQLEPDNEVCRDNEHVALTIEEKENAICDVSTRNDTPSPDPVKHDVPSPDTVKHDVPSPDPVKDVTPSSDTVKDHVHSSRSQPNIDPITISCDQGFTSQGPSTVTLPEMEWAGLEIPAGEGAIVTSCEQSHKHVKLDRESLKRHDSYLVEEGENRLSQKKTTGIMGTSLPSIGTSLPSLSSLSGIGTNLPSIGTSLPSMGTSLSGLPSMGTSLSGLPGMGTSISGLPGMGTSLPSFMSISSLIPSLGGVPWTILPSLPSSVDMASIPNPALLTGIETTPTTGPSSCVTAVSLMHSVSPLQLTTPITQLTTPSTHPIMSSQVIRPRPPFSSAPSMSHDLSQAHLPISLPSLPSALFQAIPTTSKISMTTLSAPPMPVIQTTPTISDHTPETNLLTNLLKHNKAKPARDRLTFTSNSAGNSGETLNTGVKPIPSVLPLTSSHTPGHTSQSDNLTGVITSSKHKQINVTDTQALPTTRQATIPLIPPTQSFLASIQQSSVLTTPTATPTVRYPPNTPFSLQTIPTTKPHPQVNSPTLSTVPNPPPLAPPPFVTPSLSHILQAAATSTKSSAQQLSSHTPNPAPSSNIQLPVGTPFMSVTTDDVTVSHAVTKATAALTNQQLPVVRAPVVTIPTVAVTQDSTLEMGVASVPSITMTGTPLPSVIMLSGSEMLVNKEAESEETDVQLKLTANQLKLAQQKLAILQKHSYSQLVKPADLSSLEYIGLDSQGMAYWYDGGRNMYQSQQNTDNPRKPIDSDVVLMCKSFIQWQHKLKQLRSSCHEADSKLAQIIKEIFLPRVKVATKRKPKDPPPPVSAPSPSSSAIKVTSLPYQQQATPMLVTANPTSLITTATPSSHQQGTTLAPLMTQGGPIFVVPPNLLQSQGFPMLPVFANTAVIMPQNVSHPSVSIDPSHLSSVLQGDNLSKEGDNKHLITPIQGMTLSQDPLAVKKIEKNEEVTIERVELVPGKSPPKRPVAPGNRRATPDLSSQQQGMVTSGDSGSGFTSLSSLRYIPSPASLSKEPGHAHPKQPHPLVYQSNMPSTKKGSNNTFGVNPFINPSANSTCVLRVESEMEMGMVDSHTKSMEILGEVPIRLVPREGSDQRPEGVLPPSVGPKPHPQPNSRVGVVNPLPRDGDSGELPPGRTPHEVMSAEMLLSLHGRDHTPLSDIGKTSSVPQTTPTSGTRVKKTRKQTPVASARVVAPPIIGNHGDSIVSRTDQSTASFIQEGDKRKFLIQESHPPKEGGVSSRQQLPKFGSILDTPTSVIDRNLVSLPTRGRGKGRGRGTHRATGGITSSLRATGHTPVTPPTVQSHNSNSDSSDECTSSGSDSSSDDEGTSPARVLLPPSRAGLSTDQSDDSQTSGSDSDGDERTVKGKGRARGRGRGGGVRSGVRRGGRTPKGRVEKLVPVRTARTRKPLPSSTSKMAPNKQKRAATKPSAPANPRQRQSPLSLVVKIQRKLMAPPTRKRKPHPPSDEEEPHPPSKHPRLVEGSRTRRKSVHDTTEKPSSLSNLTSFYTAEGVDLQTLSELTGTVLEDKEREPTKSTSSRSKRTCVKVREGITKLQEILETSGGVAKGSGHKGASGRGQGASGIHPRIYSNAYVGKKRSNTNTGRRSRHSSEDVTGNVSQTRSGCSYRTKYYFSTHMANSAADAVWRGKTETILDYHRTQSKNDAGFLTPPHKAEFRTSSCSSESEVEEERPKATPTPPKRPPPTTARGRGRGRRGKRGRGSIPAPGIRRSRRLAKTTNKETESEEEREIEEENETSDNDEPEVGVADSSARSLRKRRPHPSDHTSQGSSGASSEECSSEEEEGGEGELSSPPRPTKQPRYTIHEGHAPDSSPLPRSDVSCEDSPEPIVKGSAHERKGEHPKPSPPPPVEPHKTPLSIQTPDSTPNNAHIPSEEMNYTITHSTPEATPTFVPTSKQDCRREEGVRGDHQRIDHLPHPPAVIPPTQQSRGDPMGITDKSMGMYPSPQNWPHQLVQGGYPYNTKLHPVATPYHAPQGVVPGNYPYSVPYPWPHPPPQSSQHPAEQMRVGSYPHSVPNPPLSSAHHQMGGAVVQSGHGWGGQQVKLHEAATAKKQSSDPKPPVSYYDHKSATPFSQSAQPHAQHHLGGVASGGSGQQQQRIPSSSPPGMQYMYPTPGQSHVEGGNPFHYGFDSRHAQFASAAHMWQSPQVQHPATQFHSLMTHPFAHQGLWYAQQNPQQHHQGVGGAQMPHPQVMDPGKVERKGEESVVGKHNRPNHNMNNNNNRLGDCAKDFCNGGTAASKPYS